MPMAFHECLIRTLIMCEHQYVTFRVICAANYLMQRQWGSAGQEESINLILHVERAVCHIFACKEAAKSRQEKAAKEQYCINKRLY